MKRLQPPAFNSVAMVDQLVAERQAGQNAAFFTQHADEWKQRVQTYMETQGAPSFNPRWQAIQADRAKFYSLYSHPRPGQVQEPIIRAMRKNHGLLECPACGDRGVPDTLDHYLPQEHYPHFVVLPHNLAPMCGTCQRAKCSKTGDGQSPRFFLHPYFDTAADEQLVTLTIEPPFNAPTHILAVRAGLDAAIAPVVETHLRELGIPQRFGGWFTTQYTRLLRNASNLRTAGSDVAATLGSFRDAARLAGPNCWDHVFYDAVLSNALLMAYLTTSDLPAYL
ncbi:hypothetical protein [Ancylobacter mangrovi]|uniref:hypothetical protein n=1 Tax=Ancylobacter mangrovi TaxID=2972472 RepID=UPI002161272D|nr:hypothetical protein [Ancylobacter mangrovi]MCS0505150.1 hypothetical protein [Ancylobacter mangrovi]